MRIIKVSATQSSNSMAREWFASNRNSAPVCLNVLEQTAGRGQRGSSWVSNAGENLTFSIIYPKLNVEIPSQFKISMAVGLGILDAVKYYKIPALKLKWPNDIMAGKFKIGGILIENILAGEKIDASIIGIGLNINQQYFENLPKASSMSLKVSSIFSPEEVLQKLLECLEKRLNIIQDENSPSNLQNEYENSLFKRNVVSTFQLPNGNLLTGIIKGTSGTGLLQVQTKDEQLIEFDLKELKLLF